MKILNKLFLSLLFVLLLPMISAVMVPIQVTLNTTSFNFVKDTDYYYNAVIVNPNTITLDKIKLESLIAYMPEQTNFLSGESRNVSIRFRASESGTFSLNFLGYAISNYSNPDAYIINITGSGVYPEDLDVIIGDTIKWKNLKVDSVSLYDDLGEHSISSGSEYVRVCPNATTFTYFVFPDLFGGSITVQNSSLAHYSNLDYNFNVIVNMSYNPTTIEILYLSNNFTVPFPETRTGNVIIKNTGSLTAYNVNLVAPWLLFSPNNFNIDAGQEKNVEFIVNPSIYNTTDTNQTYIKTLSISGNFNTINRGISIFIPYASVSNYNTSNAIEYLNFLRNVYCANNSPTRLSILCTQEAIIEYRYLNNLSDSQFTYNMSLKMLSETFNSVLKQKDIALTTANIVKEKADAQEQSLLNITSTMGEIDKRNDENEKLFKSLVYSGVIFGSLFMCLLIGGICFFLIRKRKLKIKDDELRRW